LTRATIGPSQRLWQVGQILGVLLTAGLIYGLWFRPSQSLTILWSVVIPVLPASFLVTPALWRNLCPLASANMALNRWAKRPAVPRRLAPYAGGIGIALLALMVPARRFLFNGDGVVLGITIIVIVVLALGLGAVYQAKAGFCNALCPVLPVERLYGQHPLVELGNPRCPVCTVCTTGCIDIAPRKSIPAVLGRGRRSHEWLTSTFGIFAAAFPGFVLGYFTVDDGPLSSAGAIYLHIGVAALGSYLLTAAVVKLGSVRAQMMMPVLAALAAGVYYWFASPVFAEAVRLPPIAGQVIRVAALGLVAFWLFKALASSVRQIA
jgi:hypothetical protein